MVGPTLSRFRAVAIALAATAALVNTTGAAIADGGATGASAPANVAQAMPPADFGSPPSGEIPILFNDHHVYTKPDKLKQGRVLAAIVKGSEILVPLRSMFEQMGATVSWDPATKTADVSKPGADVKVTVGKPEVIINGESRPLDVPPEMYQGAVVVPVRVISEGMGAYVQWVPDKRLVVVRYIPAAPPTAPPTEAPPPPPTPTPTPTPTPSPVPYYYEKFVVGDWIFASKVYNEFSPGNSGSFGFTARAGLEFPLWNIPWMVEGDLTQWQYPHNANVPPLAPGSSVCPNPGEQACVATIGNNGLTYVPSFTAMDSDVDVRLGVRVLKPRIYIGIGYLLSRWSNYGYPKQQGFGFGGEKLPDLDQPFSVYGAFWYYPSIKGYNFYDPVNGLSYTIGYRVYKYKLGGTANFGHTGFFFDLGWAGDKGTVTQNAPSAFSHNGGYAGIGYHF